MGYERSLSKMKTKKYISLLMAIIMMLSLFAGCGSEGNTPSVSDDKDTLYLRLSSALQSTDWQQTSAMEGNKITYVQLFEGLYGIDESAGGYYRQRIFRSVKMVLPIPSSLWMPPSRTEILLRQRTSYSAMSWQCRILNSVM